MKKKFTKKNITLGFVVLLIVFQFFRIDKTNKNSAPEKDILQITNPDIEISNILKNSCYDCHSNQVTYPWYTNVAPISWWIKHHINEGSHHLNFSEWGDYSSRKADHKLKECAEMVEEGEMPMTSYTIIHRNATLSKEQQTLLVTWFNSLRTHESDKPKEN
jgi:hypothetical protein